MSESSDLSEAPSEVEDTLAVPAPEKKKKTLKLKQGILNFSKHVERPPTPESPPREPSPPHEYVLADNPIIAFLVMFRHRFADAFPKHVPNLGPQDLEQGVVESSPSERVENFLCALLGLVLNRKKDVERGHHNRALEEAISANKHQWVSEWQGMNPLPGQRTFPDLSPEEKLVLLKALTLWSLNTSDMIKEIIALAYKQTRKDDDINQPLSVQSWGTDGRKKRYWLIEGQHDTSFRIYKEGLAKDGDPAWWSVAGSLDDLRALSDNLRIEDGKQPAKRLADRMEMAVPRLEASEEKRKRKEYRQSRKNAFTKPEPGFSLYEGRTRGKRMKYTFSDEEDEGSDAGSTRRSNRPSDRSTPAEPNGPTMTSSGRQVRSRFGRSYGDPLPRREAERRASTDPLQSDQEGSGRRTRGHANGTSRLGELSHGNTSEEEDAEPSGEDWQGNDEDYEGKMDNDEDDEMGDDDSDDSLMNEPRSLIVKLRYGQGRNLQHPNGSGLTPTIKAPSGTVSESPYARPSSAQSRSANGHHAPAPKPHSRTSSSNTKAAPRTSSNTGGTTPSVSLSPSTSVKQPPPFKPDPYGEYKPQQYFNSSPYAASPPKNPYHPQGSLSPQHQASVPQYPPSHSSYAPQHQSPYGPPPPPRQQPYGPPQHHHYGPPPPGLPPPSYQHYPSWQPPQHPGPPHWQQNLPHAGAMQQQPFPGAMQQQPPPPQYQHSPPPPGSAGRHH